MELLDVLVLEQLGELSMSSKETFSFVDPALTTHLTADDPTSLDYASPGHVAVHTLPNDTDIEGEQLGLVSLSWERENPTNHC